MIDYLSLLSGWMDKPHYLLVILICVYAFTSMLDFLAGITNAIYTQKIPFSSKKAQYGIIRKILTLLMMIAAVPMAMLFPMDIAVYSLTVLYMGIVTTEMYSVLGHLGIVKDGDKHKHVVGIVFTEFLEKLIGNFKDKSERK